MKEAFRLIDEIMNSSTRLTLALIFLFSIVSVNAIASLRSNKKGAERTTTTKSTTTTTTESTTLDPEQERIQALEARKEEVKEMVSNDKISKTHFLKQNLDKWVKWLGNQQQTDQSAPVSTSIVPSDSATKAAAAVTR